MLAIDAPGDALDFDLALLLRCEDAEAAEAAAISRNDGAWWALVLYLLSRR